VTEVSEFRRGRVEGRSVFLRVGLGCSRWPSRSGSQAGHSAGRPEVPGRASAPGATEPPALGRKYCRSLSIVLGVLMLCWFLQMVCLCVSLCVCAWVCLCVWFIQAVLLRSGHYWIVVVVEVKSRAVTGGHGGWNSQSFGRELRLLCARNRRARRMMRFGKEAGRTKQARACSTQWI
jgi:hypothetical protein